LFAKKILHAKRSMQIIEIRYMWPSFNDFAIKNFTSFFAMTLTIAKKTITAVFGTMALQLIEALQHSVTSSIKQTSSSFWLLQWFHCVWLLLNAVLCIDQPNYTMQLLAGPTAKCSCSLAIRQSCNRIPILNKANHFLGAEHHHLNLEHQHHDSKQFSHFCIVACGGV